MKKIIYKMDQGSEEWHIAKLGVFSASKAELSLVKGKGENNLGAGLLTYVKEKSNELLVVEHDFSGFYSKSTQRGISEEAVARKQFSLRNMIKVDEVGFIKLDGLRVGCSPDGEFFLGSEKGLEIKCFGSKNHLEIVRSGVVPKKVIAQVQYSMMVTGYDEWRVVFWDDRVVEALQYKEFSIKRDEDMITLMYKKAKICSEMVDADVAGYSVEPSLIESETRLIENE
jgi:hypothetical protein